MSYQQIRSALLTTTLVSGLALGLAACGDDDDDGGSSSSTGGMATGGTMTGGTSALTGGTSALTGGTGMGGTSAMTGGTTATGGMTATGGTTMTGGTTATGGTTMTGGTTATGGTGTGGTTAQTITAIAAANPDFETLVGALKTAGLDDDLAGPGPFTVFAPTDAAFALLPANALQGADLASILTYHVVSGNVPAATAITLSEATTLQGGKIKLGTSGSMLYLNGGTLVTTTDIQASNGVIHVIDSVLFPGEFPGTVTDVVKAYPRLSTLAGAVTPTVAGALSCATPCPAGVTLFAPVNSAFTGVTLPSATADLEKILTYHAVGAEVVAADVLELASAKTVNGAYLGVKTTGGVKLNDASKDTNVIYTDIQAKNGVVHLIDKVLIPPGNIVEVATKVGGFSKLLAAAGAANVPGTTTKFAAALTGAGPFTLFAPPDAAFDKIPTPGFSAANLPNVLGAHAFGSVVDSAAVVTVIGGTGKSGNTLTGAADKQLELALVGGKVYINQMVQVTTTDIPASNGIIHVVDSVIVPSDVPFPGNIVQALSAYPVFASLVTSATNSPPVVTTLSGAGPFTLFAPTSAAFTAAGVNLTANSAGVLTYHVLPQQVLAANLTTGTPTTAQGTTVSINAPAKTVDTAKIVRTDLRASNGVIHVIDKVITP